MANLKVPATLPDWLDDVLQKVERPANSITVSELAEKAPMSISCARRILDGKAKAGIVVKKVIHVMGDRNPTAYYFPPPESDDQAEPPQGMAGN